MNDPVVLDTYTQLVEFKADPAKEELMLDYEYSLPSRQTRIVKVSDHRNVSPNHDWDANFKSLGDENRFSTSCTECRRRKQRV
jgi:hypothetical protein